MYRPSPGGLEWHEPSEGKNCHVEIAVRDRADGRFIPDLDIEVTLSAEGGGEVGMHRQPFIWHPWLWPYGRNCRCRMKAATTSPCGSGHRSSTGTTAPRASDTLSPRRFASEGSPSAPGRSSRRPESGTGAPEPGRSATPARSSACSLAAQLTPPVDPRLTPG
jgi:hypothetical protein